MHSQQISPQGWLGKEEARLVQECRRGKLWCMWTRGPESPGTPPSPSPHPHAHAPQLPLETVHCYEHLVTSTLSHLHPNGASLPEGRVKAFGPEIWVLLCWLCLSQDLGWKWFHSKIKFPVFRSKGPWKQSVIRKQRLFLVSWLWDCEQIGLTTAKMKQFFSEHLNTCIQNSTT